MPACLILGETGAGKELVARAIHDNGSRRDRPLIKINCTAIPRELFESEFFGHNKGAFSGAVTDRIGRFQLADHGTLFLDEIGELPKDLQPKLLRVLQDGEFEPVGSDRTRHVNVRIIAATNRDIKSLVGPERLREDLYYRLSVFPIEVPPLRERRDDIAAARESFSRRGLQTFQSLGSAVNREPATATTGLRLARKRSRAAERRRARGDRISPRVAPARDSGRQTRFVRAGEPLDPNRAKSPR